MINQNLEILWKYLSKMNYTIDRKELYKMYLSDSEEGILPITNTLDHFGINFITVSAPKSIFYDLPNNFITRLSTDKSSTLSLIEKVQNDKVSIFIDAKKSFIVPTSEFLEQWTGLVIAVEKNEGKSLSSDKIVSTLFISAFLVISLFYLHLQEIKMVKTLHFSLTLVGIFLSIMALKEKYNSQFFNSKFCNVSEFTNCQDVLNSSSNKILKYLDLTDVSIIYFLFVSIFTLYSPENNVVDLLSLASPPIIIYSLYYQYFILRKLCTICICISAVLSIQFILSFTSVKFRYPNTFEILITFILILSLLYTWRYIKYLLSKYNQSAGTEIENLYFRRNTQLFLSYYESLPEVKDIDLLKSIRFGTTKPKLHLSIITNPLCNECEKAHHLYTKLIKEYPEDLQVQILFLVPNNKNNLRWIIAEKLLEIFYEKGSEVCLEALSDWYEKRNFEFWQKKWPVAYKYETGNMINLQIRFLVNNGFDSTPNVLINKKKFPKHYRMEDIENFIKPIINNQAYRYNDIKTEALDVSK